MASITLKGVPLSDAVATLREVEARIPDQLADVHERPARYFRYREWMIRGGLLGRMLRAAFYPSLQTVPGLDMPKDASARVRRMARLTAAALDVRNSRGLRLRADALFLNTNLRSFYVSGGSALTLKAAIRNGEVEVGDAFRSSLSREIEARQYAERFVPVPPILHYDASGTIPFLLEPLIWGRRPCPATSNHVCDALLPGLISMYEDYGYRIVRPADLIGGDDGVGEIGRGLDYLSLPAAVRKRCMAAISTLMESPRRVPLSFIHGDLAPNNLLIDSEGGVTVLDWERAGEGLVARDFFYLLRGAVGRKSFVEAELLESLARFCPVGQVCTLDEQLATVGAMALARWREFAHMCATGGRKTHDVHRQLSQYAGLLSALPPVREPLKIAA